VTAEIRRGKKEERRNGRAKIYFYISASATQGGHKKRTIFANCSTNMFISMSVILITFQNLLVYGRQSSNEETPTEH